MKRLFLSLLLASMFIGKVSAQVVIPDSVKISPDSDNNIVSFVFETKNTPEAAFNKAKQWVAKNFDDYKQVVQMEDAASHSLVFKGLQLIGRYKGSYGGYATEHSLSLEYTVTIECKEGKFRIKFEDLRPKGTNYFSGMREVPLKLNFSDAKRVKEERNNPKADKGYVAMLENILPGSKSTIATLATSLAQSISYYDDF